MESASLRSIPAVLLLDLDLSTSVTKPWSPHFSEVGNNIAYATELSQMLLNALFLQ